MLNDNIKTLKDYVNTPIELGPSSICKINDKNFIVTQLYSQKGNKFYDVVLNKNGKSVFIGRFDKEYDFIQTKYNDGKILVFYDEFDKNSEKMQVVEVISLFDMLDELVYACTEEEALNMFDKNIDTSYLKNPDRNIRKSDIERKKRIK